MRVQFGLLFVLNIFILTQCYKRTKSMKRYIAHKKHLQQCGPYSGPDCKYDPDEHLDVPQIIRRYGYPSETHTVETKDGYLLQLHRIPGDKNGKTGGQPVFVQHGLLGSSADWVLNKNSSLAFNLADRGYDVWLGNARGNTYSRGHVSLPEWSAQYWNFTWHEMGTIDLPTVLYHVGNVTGKSGEIIYIGHSMGTTMFFVLSSTMPQVAKTVKLMIALAPVAYMTHVRSPVRYLAPFVTELEWIERELGLTMFLPSTKILSLLAYECNKNFTRKICDNILFVIGGFDKEEFNMKIIDAVASHDPAGSSTKTLLHYAQEIKYDGNFQNYDYGEKGNIAQYGTPNPPQYNLTNIKRPVYLVYAEGDSLASGIDVYRLSQKLSNLVDVFKVPMDAFNHIDFLFGKDVYKLVYKPIIDVMQNFTMT